MRPFFIANIGFQNCNSESKQICKIDHNLISHYQTHTLPDREIPELYIRPLVNMYFGTVILNRADTELNKYVIT